MKRIIILPIMIIIFSLAVSVQAISECTDGMALNIQGGESFECHFTQCAGLIASVSITPYQDALSGEYSLVGCANIDILQDGYTGSIRYVCPCTDDYTFNLTTAVNSNGTYHITFNQTIIEYGPAFNSTIPNQTIQETNLLTVTLSAYDNDTAQSNLTYSTDVSFGSMADNIYTWQTDYSSEGTYNITFFVTDGTYTDNQTMILVVTHKDEPAPPPDDNRNTGGGGGGGGAVSTCGDGICSGFEGCDSCEIDCGKCAEEIVPKEIVPEEKTATPAETFPGTAGLEGITGEAAGNLTGEGKGIGGIITGAVTGILNKPGVKAAGALFLLAILIALIALFFSRRKKKSPENES